MEEHTHPEIIQMQTQFLELARKVNHHEKLLVTGTDDTLSLPEIVRALANTVNTYIKRKEKEEEESKGQWDRLKWAFLGTIIPASLVFIVQAVFFFFKFVPIMAKLAEN